VRRGWARHLHDALAAWLPQTRWSDRLLATLQFRAAHGRWPDSHRSMYTDVLHHMKVSREILDPLRVFTTDKALAKLYIHARLGEDLAVPTLAVLRTPDEVASYQWPADCVIKPTHMSGRCIVRRAGSPVDVAQVQSWLVSDYARMTHEANYRNLRRQVIVEPFALGQAPARDWCFFCVHGEVRMIVVDHGEMQGTRPVRSRYTADWELIPVGASGGPPGRAHPPPPNLDALKDIAGRLAAPFSFVRVDLYTDGEAVLVGELTHCAGNGQTPYPDRSKEQRLTRQLFGADVVDAQAFFRPGARAPAPQKNRMPPGSST
jgi:hypothetical protein